MKLTAIVVGAAATLAVAAMSIDTLTQEAPRSLPPLTTLPKYQETTPRPTESHGDTKESTTTALATTTSSTSTTSTTLPDTKCAEWWPMADSLGWSLDQWATLSHIIWRESRCQPDAYNPTDPNGGSYGLTQINGFWIDYLCQHWEICHPNELFDPQISLASTWVLYSYSVEKNGCGWHPWRTPC